eukprot:1477998-Amphidinium_carterae.1
MFVVNTITYLGAKESERVISSPQDYVGYARLTSLDFFGIWSWWKPIECGGSLTCTIPTRAATVLQLEFKDGGCEGKPS